jgi:hypothetical protein
VKFLKNYTSNQQVAVSIARIEHVLIRCGVRGIMKEYRDDGRVSAVTFQADVEGKKLAIRLPANEAAVTDMLWKDYAGEDYDNRNDTIVAHRANIKKKRRADFIEQGERTAWKIVQDWVEVQMSMVQMGQVELLEVFLSYVYDGRKTYFQSIKDRKYVALLPSGKEHHDDK